MVVTSNTQQIGFLDRYLAAMLSKRMDQHGGVLQAVVSGLVGDTCEGWSLGVRIKFELPE
jgi:uncharacterized membrane protein YeaQ/YmgE (transglycosylase-associated protein family)